MQTSIPTLGAGDSDKHWLELFEHYYEDESLRARIHGGEASEVLSEHGITVPGTMEVQFVENTDDVTHVIFPSDPNQFLSDEQLSSVAGGDTAGTLGTAGSLSSFPSSVSSALSAGSVSSASM